jgi:hypothetical protein
MPNPDEVTFAVSVSKDDRARLARSLGPKSDRMLEIVLKAGAEEARDLATGRAVFSTMAELRSYRVYCLVRAGLSVQDAATAVAALFKISPSGARRVVATSLSRYAIELADDVDTVVTSTLEGATWHTESESWRIELPAGFTRDRILELARASTEPDPRPVGRGTLWSFPEETYAWLRAQTGLPARTTQ